MKKFYIAILIILSSVNSSAQQRNRFFSIDSAGMMQWHGGAAWSSSGTSYEFYITFKKSCTIRFDSVWIGTEKSLPFILISTSNYKKADTIFKKDSSYILYVQFVNPGSYFYEERKNIQEGGSPVPMNYEGAALISYVLNEKKNYCIAKYFKTLPSPQYP